MKTVVESVRLTPATSQDERRIVRTCALFTFRALRAVAEYASQLPDVASKAASDVAEAWEESRRPNA